MTDKQSNLIELNGQQFAVGFQPAVVDLSSLDAMDEAVKEICSNFKDYEVTAGNLKVAKATRAELNKFSKKLNDRKILLVKQADAPVIEFKNRIKRMTDEIKSTSQGINDSIKIFDDREKQFKHERNIEQLKKLAEEAGVDAEFIEYDSRWDNKSFSNVQFETAVKSQILALQQAQKAREDNVTIIKQKADTLQLMTSHYIQMLDSGKPLSEVLSQMDVDHQEILAVAERQKESKKKERENLVKHGNKAINPETGEVVDQLYSATLITRKAKLKIEGTTYQFKQLINYLKDMGFKISKEQ